MRSTECHESRHLLKTDLIDSTGACPICLDTRPRKSVLQVQISPEVHFLKCERCNGYSASHMPTSEYLQKYYRKYYAEKDRNVTFSGEQRFARHVLGLIPRFPWGDEVRVLDFGSGDGSLAFAIASHLLSENANRRVQMLLVDFQPPPDFRDDRISIRHVPSFEEISGEFDLVLASAILEHIPFLNSVMQSLFAATARRGYFYARTPFVIPFSRFLPNLDITFPGHLHDLGVSFWNQITLLIPFEADYVVSRPSVVATSWKDPLRTVLAYAFKLPGHVEGALLGSRRKQRFWNLVGGWEVLLQRS